MLSDSHLHINIFHGGRFDRWGSNPHKPLTWIRELAVFWGHHLIEFSARKGASWQYSHGYMDQIQIDGQKVTRFIPGQPMTFCEGKVQISWLSSKLRDGDDDIDVYELKIDGVLQMILKLRPEIALLRTPEDGIVHFGIEIPFVNVSPNVHGILGQTFRSDHSDRLLSQKLVHNEKLNRDEVEGDNAEGFLDGVALDYETTSQSKTDCQFSRFSRSEAPDAETAMAIELSSISVESSKWAMSVSG